MRYPSQKLSLIYAIVILFFASAFVIFKSADSPHNRTEKQLLKIARLLEKEKKDIGGYPIVLKTIIRNNPLLKEVTKDYWNNEINYQLSDDRMSCPLFSLGKDKTPNTKDDITIGNKTQFE
jgi:general secretion pathway protein G